MVSVWPNKLYSIWIERVRYLLFPDVEDFYLVVDSADEYLVVGVVEGNGGDLVLVLVV